MEPELNVAWISGINVIIALDSPAANPLYLRQWVKILSAKHAKDSAKGAKKKPGGLKPHHYTPPWPISGSTC